MFHFRHFLNSKVFNTIFTRNQSSKLIKFEEKLKPAEKIKKLHYENKYLFGAKTKEPKVQKGGAGKKKVQAIEAVVDDEDTSKQHDKSGEMFWLLQHKPVLDFEKPSKQKKVKPEKPKIEISIKKKVPKIKLAGDPFNHHVDRPLLKNDPKLELIKSTMDISFQSKLPSLAKEKAVPLIERDIPFDLQQLRQITSFPVSIGKQKILDLFQPFDLDQSSNPIPSVSKVLQATMPIVSRNALVLWKTTKLAELGLEGFNLLQQCESLNTNPIKTPINLTNFPQHIWIVENSSMDVCKTTSVA